MKQQKKWLFICIAVLFALSACLQVPQSSATFSAPSSAVTTINPQSSTIVSETPSVVNSAVTTINLKKQYDEDELIKILLKHTEDGIQSILAVYEYPSPDNTQKFIEVKANEGYPDSWSGYRNYIFLNDLDHFFYRYWDNYHEAVGAVWIDNLTVAIGAEVIVNLKTGERKDMEMPVINNSYLGLTELHVRSGLYIEELDSLIYIKDFDSIFYMFKYSLKDGTWTELFQRQLDWQYMDYYLHFKRENENEVSFNTEKNNG